mmetsp:Transcript_5027/g.7682  ORF Transcript_5027/g.7682 Transcript_5027/m.7682 type:complete len:191 (+) Transcript_5027:29-601(+)
MDGSWDDIADKWEDQEGVKTYSENAFQSLMDVVSLSRNERVLDFGCGTGLLAEKLAPHVRNIVAVDASPKMIEVLNRKNIGNIKPISCFLTGEVVSEHDDLQEKFDLIVASSALLFVPDFEGTLSVLKSLLSDNGVIVQWDWLADSSDSEMGFTEDRVRNAYTAAGLRVRSISFPFAMDSMRVIMAVGNL